MEQLKLVAEVIGCITAIGGAVGVIVGVILTWQKVVEGIRCMLRSEMLRTYYHNKERKKIRQYEMQNFILLYKAYKALKGNSFIDEIYQEVTSWEIIS